MRKINTNEKWKLTYKLFIFCLLIINNIIDTHATGSSEHRGIDSYYVYGSEHRL